MRVAALVVAGLLLAGCGATKTVTTTVTSTKTVTVQQPPATSAPSAENTTYFGEIVSMSQESGKYLLVLKPLFYLVGVTANTAFAEQQGKQCDPLSCPGVEDDRLTLPAGNQKLTFVVPATTKGTVLSPSQQPLTVSAAQLAALVGGAKTPKLVEPVNSGMWLAVDVDKVTSFAQQFQP